MTETPVPLNVKVVAELWNIPQPVVAHIYRTGFCDGAMEEIRRNLDIIKREGAATRKALAAIGGAA